MAILEDICFGKFQFEVAVVLRNSLLINGILTNAEAWYDIKKADLETLEKVDESLLRQVLEAPCSTPREMLHLEMGLLPIRFIIMSRRLNFLHCILRENKESLVYRFFKAQYESPVKNDWTETVREDLANLNLPSIDDIQNLNQNTFHTLVRRAIEKEAFEYLLRKKNGDSEKNSGHSKVSHIKYNTFEMQDYLRPNTISNQEAKFIFLLRTRMLDLKGNFKSGHTSILCIACNAADETQEHLLSCSELREENVVVETLPQYEHLFGENLKEKITVAGMLSSNFKKRKSFK